ncbi:hypothetical protein ANACOL_03880 [Anaerotruncus colihominis DSM 17241]|uniref:Uncharacterized protein n=1 Tax=Anaerotruncus colihominis DSM 17241 TaxID=445972 RepID=B0PGE7_9FIRM|nr:hypothetical protein ANACOL_03880 [Anaerotruncus colihominis DSM 17241]
MSCPAVLEKRKMCPRSPRRVFVVLNPSRTGASGGIFYAAFTG